MDPTAPLVNPWFQRWPQNGVAKRDAVRIAPAPKKLPMKTLPEFIRGGNYPPRFLQVIPVPDTVIVAGRSVEIPIKLDDDFPYRLDAVAFEFQGFADAERFARVAVPLPSGTRLTRQPVDGYAFSGNQGGKAFVHFRHRFSPSDILVFEVSNSGTQDFTVRGLIYGYKLTTDDRR